MSWGFYRFIDNWHKHPWISPILCKIGRHNYEFYWMDGDCGILRCFYCEKQKNSKTSFGYCKKCKEELGKEWKCYNKQCETGRQCRRDEIAKAIAEGKAQGLYEISEHLTSEVLEDCLDSLDDT